MRAPEGGRRPMAEINVTPMVDVMLVLLVIFMVAAPLIQEGVTVALPAARGQPLPEKAAPIVVTLTREGQIYLGKTLLPRAGLRERLVGNRRLMAEREAWLHADRQAAYGDVVDLMTVLKDAGVDNLGMVTDPLAPAGGGASGR